MSSLWTPEGEHRVEHDRPGAPGSPPPASPPASPPGAGDEGPPSAEDDAAIREEFRQLEAELLAAPVEEVIANHCYGLFQLAALHLGQQPPNLDKARLAIDALAAIVEGLGPRLGEPAQTFTEGLAQLRLAYVQLYGAAGAAAAGTAPPEAGAGAATDDPDGGGGAAD